MATFQEMFKAQYGISLHEEYTMVKNIAPQALINHVHTTMHTTTHKNHSITKETVKERISVYSDRLNQSNASKYFMRNNAIHYDPNTGSYKNVSFSNEIAKSYESLRDFVIMSMSTSQPTCMVRH